MSSGTALSCAVSGRISWCGSRARSVLAGLRRAVTLLGRIRSGNSRIGGKIDASGILLGLSVC